MSMTVRTNPTTEPADTEACGRPATRYERQWDDYSRFWDEDPHFRRYRFLGDEWGSEEWIAHNVDTFVLPYLDRSSRVVEIGPGGGRYTARLIGNCAELIGVDVSGEMVRRAAERFRHHDSVRIQKGDGRTLAGIGDGEIDLVFSFNTFVQIGLEDLYGYLLEIGRVLRPGGHAVLQYAEFSGDEGWSYFLSQRNAWSDDPEQRGRFCELTLSSMDLLADRAGLEVARNQHVARDGLVVVRRPDGSASCLGPEQARDSRTRRDFSVLERHLETLAEDVYHELPTPHHTAAAHHAVDDLLVGLEFRSALELGCGTGPTLDRLAELGKETRGVSLGAEECAHPVVHADMHFSGLPADCCDLVIARHIIEHSVMPLLLLMEMARLTRRYALVVVPCDEEIWVDWHNHYSVLSKPMWRKLFTRAGFSIRTEADGPLEPDSTEWRFLLEKNGTATAHPEDQAEDS